MTIPVEPAEYEYLTWFRQSCDFGPAHEDVIAAMHEDYTAETGNSIPEGWE